MPRKMGYLMTSLVLLAVKCKCWNLGFFLTLTQNLLIATDVIDVAKEDIDPLPFPATGEKISSLQ